MLIIKTLCEVRIILTIQELVVGWSIAEVQGRTRIGRDAITGGRFIHKMELWGAGKKHGTAPGNQGCARPVPAPHSHPHRCRVGTFARLR